MRGQKNVKVDYLECSVSVNGSGRDCQVAITL